MPRIVMAGVQSVPLSMRGGPVVNPVIWDVPLAARGIAGVPAGDCPSGHARNAAGECKPVVSPVRNAIIIGVGLGILYFLGRKS